MRFERYLHLLGLALLRTEIALPNFFLPKLLFSYEIKYRVSYIKKIQCVSYNLHVHKIAFVS